MRRDSDRRDEATTPPRQTRDRAPDALSSLLRDATPPAPAAPTPGGQLVLPGHAGQLGLDGRVYAPVVVGAPPSGEAASSSLGPLHHVSHDPDAPPDPGPVATLPGQLTLAPELFEATAQVSMWRRLDVARALLDGRTDSNRDAKCQRTRFAADGIVGVTRHASGKYSLAGVISCDRMTCPACGPRRARALASKLAVAIAKHHRAPFADTWMLTLAPPHVAGDAPATSVQRLYDACALFLRSAEWRRFAKAHGVVGKVRALDATHGGRNGLHAHFHIAVFVENAGISSAWEPSGEQPRRAKRTDDEFVDAMVRALTASPVASSATDMFRLWEPLRMSDETRRAAYLAELGEVLIPGWERACLEAGIAVRDRTAFRRHALTLSPSENAAAYFTKWGLADEVGAPTAKGNSHLRLLDICAAGGRDGDVAGDLYRSFREAVDGYTWVSGLADICKRLAVTDDDAAAYIAELRAKREKMLAAAGVPIVVVRELKLEIWSHLYPAAARLGWERVFAFVDECDARNGEVQSELSRFLWHNLESAYLEVYRRRGLDASTRTAPRGRADPPTTSAVA